MAASNPYASPGSDGQGYAWDLTLNYYRLDSRKISFREYRRISQNVFVLLISLVLKVLRIPLAQTVIVAAGGTFRRVAPEALSEAVRETLRQSTEEAIAEEWEFRFCYEAQSIGTAETVAAVYSNSAQDTILMSVCSRFWNKVTQLNQLDHGLITFYANDRTLATSSSNARLDGTPEIDGQTFPGISLAELKRKHSQRVAQRAVAPLVFVDNDALEAALRDYERLNFDFYIQRGVFVPVAAEEVPKYLRAAEMLPEPPSPARRKFMLLELLFYGAIIGNTTLMYLLPPRTPRGMIVYGSFLLLMFLGIICIHLYRFFSTKRSGG